MANLSSCPPSVKPHRRSRRRSQVVYRVRNWPAYDAGLQQRGSLTVWFTPQAVEAWYYQGPRQGAIYLFGGRHPNGVDLAAVVSLAAAPNRGVRRLHPRLDRLGGTGARSHDPIAASGRLDGGLAAPAQGSTPALGRRRDGVEGVWRRRVEGASARLEQAAHVAQICT